MQRQSYKIIDKDVKTFFKKFKIKNKLYCKKPVLNNLIKLLKHTPRLN